MIWDLLNVFTRVRSTQKLFADDKIDKLNRAFTVILLIIAALFILSRTYGVPISCLDEGARTTPVTMDYINAVCWANGLFKLDNFFESGIRNKTPSTLFYSYPWMPLMACLLAFLFYTPYLLWKSFIRNNSYQHVPVDINGIVEMLKKSNLDKKDDLPKSILKIGDYLDQCFSLNNFQDGYLDEYDDFFKSSVDGPKSSFHSPKTYKNRINKKKLKFVYFSLMLKYLLIKFLYLAISLAVFPLVDLMLQFRTLSFTRFGIETVNKIYFSDNQTNINYVTSQYFPRFVKCSLNIKADISQINKYNFQCALPANIFNETIFLVLWAWFVLLVALNVYSLFQWVFRLIFRRAIIKEILLWPFRYNYQIDKYVDSFVYDYLNTEGFLVLMLIRSNTQDWYCRILVRVLWKLYMARFNDESDHGEFVKSVSTETSIIPPPPPPSGVDSTAKVMFRHELNNYDRNLGRTPVKTKECKNNYVQTQDF